MYLVSRLSVEVRLSGVMCVRNVDRAQLWWVNAVQCSRNLEKLVPLLLRSDSFDRREPTCCFLEPFNLRRQVLSCLLCSRIYHTACDSHLEFEIYLKTAIYFFVLHQSLSIFQIICEIVKKVFTSSRRRQIGKLTLARLILKSHLSKFQVKFYIFPRVNIY